MAKPPLDPKLINRLQRFLHTGIEEPKYYPGCWWSHQYFELDKLEVLNEIFAQDINNLEVVDLIVKAFKDGYYTRYETICFALCMCLLRGGPAVKEAVYKGISEVCLTPEHILLFAKYSRTYKTGHGQGWCRSIRSWYMRKEPMELAKDLTRVRARHGNTHGTLIRKSHVKVNETDVARNAVVLYELFGMKRAKQMLPNNPGAKEVLDYIQTVESLRRCEDPASAAAIAAQCNFTLEHVPVHLLTTQEVWNAVLPQFTMEEILYNLQRIHNMGFLSSDSTTTAVLLSLLNNKELIERSQITPIAVYITICDYKKLTRPLKHAKAKVAAEKKSRRRMRQIRDPITGIWNWTVTRRHPRELKHWGIDQPPNPEILAALQNLLDQTWLLTPATGARYLITMDMRNHMFKGRHFCTNDTVPKKVRKLTAAKRVTTTSATPASSSTAAPVTAPAAGGDTDPKEKKSNKRPFAECFFNKHVSPGHAAIILALHLLKREKQVKLAVFTDEGIQVLSIKRNLTNIDEVECIFRNATLGKVQLDAPILWAEASKERVDVFINMVDKTTRIMELSKEERGGRGQGGLYGPPPQKDVPDRCPARALQRYKTELNVPNAKLVTMCLASHRVRTTDGSHEGVLDIVGLDEHVPKVIDAFVKGQFK